jgi:tetratricopeptide (TPR) repeat protein
MKNRIIDIIERFWFVLLIIFCCVVLSIRFVSGQTLEIKDAKRLIEVDQTGKAINVLNNATKTYPTNSIVWYHLAMAQIKNGQRDLAANSLDKGISLDIKEPMNYVGRGYLSMLENNAQKAQLDFDQALTMSKSKNVSVLRGIAEAYLVDSKFAAKALELATKAKSIDDHDPQTLVVLGDAYLAQNNGGLAVTNYERAAALDNKLAFPYYKIGLVYLRSRNFTSAQEAFSKAIEIDPGYTLAYKELGELYYQMKNGEKAVKSYETYLSLTDKPEIGKLRYAFFLFMAKDFAKANELFRGLVKNEDVSPITLRFYAFSLYEAGDYTESRNVFEQYFSKSPQAEIEASDYATYAKLLLKQNEDSLAIIQLRKSLAMDSKQTEVMQSLAETLFKTKKYPESIIAYNDLMAIRSRATSQDYYTLGRAYYFNSQFSEADSIFQKLIELQPNMTVGYLWEARTKSNLDPESVNGLAKPYYEKLIEKASATPEKNKNDLVEAYSYLGYYHLLKEEHIVSKSYWKKVLELSPTDAKAKEALKAIN